MGRLRRGFCRCRLPRTVTVAHDFQPASETFGTVAQSDRLALFKHAEYLEQLTELEPEVTASGDRQGPWRAIDAERLVSLDYWRL